MMMGAAFSCACRLYLDQREVPPTPVAFCFPNFFSVRFLKQLMITKFARIWPLPSAYLPD
jgi:hypothetical protein